ncbi:hypothetical protein [Ferrovum sp.]|uniref:hypothetical protein n=1 Tax=Ferrovum sp. TaxID=2609467 RepID=UPI002605CA5E|nr:hypothetical protein [Ferrovum sp.]
MFPGFYSRAEVEIDHRFKCFGRQFDLFHDFPQRVLQRLRIPCIQIRSQSFQHAAYVVCRDGAQQPGSSALTFQSIQAPHKAVPFIFQGFDLAQQCIGRSGFAH